MCVSGDHKSRVVEAYLKALKRRRYSVKTIETYRYPLNLFISFLAARSVVRLQDVGGEDLAAWRLALVKRGFADATLEVFLRAVRNLFNWMEGEGMLFDNPADSLKTPRYQRRLLPVLSEEQINHLLARPNVTRPVGIRDRAIMETGYCCGLRREELARLALRDPDFLQKSLRVLGKGRRERVLPLGDQACGWLRRYVEKARPVLLGRGDSAAVDDLWIAVNGRALGAQAISVMLRKYGQEAKLSGGVTPHSLRRASATHMLKKGAHPVQIQMFLGHSTMRHLAQYLRLSVADIKKMHSESRLGQ